MTTIKQSVDATSLAILTGGLGQLAMIAWGVWALFH